MNNCKILDRKSPILTAVSLLMSSVGLFPQAQAATLYHPSSGFLEATQELEQIDRAFAVSNLLMLDALDLQSFSLGMSSEQARKALEMSLALSKSDTVTPSALSLDTVANSLKRLEFNFDRKQKTNVSTLSQVGLSDVYEGIYEFKNLYGRRSPIERLVGDYLAFDSRAVSLTELPKNYYYNKNTVTIGIAKAIFSGNPNEVSIERYVDRAEAIIDTPNVKDGLKLNRVKPEEQHLDSTLQLWPRNPLSLAVKGYEINSEEKLKQVEQFGNLELGVNFRLLPKDILLTQLDLEVDWVNEGEYSNNLRRNVEELTERNRLSQEIFQNRVESRQAERYNQQSEYQSAIQKRLNQRNLQQASLQQQREQRNSSLSHYNNTPKINLNLTPKNLPLVPKTVPSPQNVNASAQTSRPYYQQEDRPLDRKPQTRYQPTVKDGRTAGRKPSIPALPR